VFVDVCKVFIMCLWELLRCFGCSYSVCKVFMGVFKVFVRVFKVPVRCSWEVVKCLWLFVKCL